MIFYKIVEFEGFFIKIIDFFVSNIFFERNRFVNI